MGSKKKTLNEELAQAELEQEIYTAHTMGLSLRTIQKKKGINRQTANRMIKKVKKQIVTAATKLVVEEHLAEELHRIHMLIGESYGGWQRSIGQKKKTIKESGGEEGKSKVTTWTEPGDPRFIEAIKGLIVERNRLLGTYEIVSGGKAGASGGAASLTRVELHQSVYIPGLGNLSNDEMTEFLKDIEAKLDANASD